MIKINKSTVLYLVLYGCEIRSLTQGREHRLKVYENRVLRGVFGTKGEEWQEAGEDCIMRSFITCGLLYLSLR
jgi:hypothetical protein